MSAETYVDGELVAVRCMFCDWRGRTLEELNQHSCKEERALNLLRKAMVDRGYTVVISPDGREEQVIRPDGTVAVIARRPENMTGGGR